jgi:hypothetical protein
LVKTFDKDENNAIDMDELQARTFVNNAGTPGHPSNMSPCLTPRLTFNMFNSVHVAPQKIEQ